MYIDVSTIFVVLVFAKVIEVTMIFTYILCKRKKIAKIFKKLLDI